MSKIVFITTDVDDSIRDGSVHFEFPKVVERRLSQMVGVTPEAFSKNYIRMTLTPVAQFQEISIDFLKYSAENVLPLLDGRRVVLIGPFAAQAFGFERHEYNYARWFDHPTENILFSVIPNVNASMIGYNNPEIYEMVRSFLDVTWSLTT